MTGALHALLPPALLLLLTVGAACPGADGPTGDDAGVIDHADAGAPHEGCAAATQLEVQDTEAGPAALPGDVAAGVERCDADSFNRIAAVSCLAPAGVDACDPADGETGGECAADADCARNAQCIRLSFDHCGCVAPCATDADCGAGEACVCSAGVTEGGGFLGMLGVPSCVPAACSTGADCASAWASTPAPPAPSPSPAETAAAPATPTAPPATPAPSIPRRRRGAAAPP